MAKDTSGNLKDLSNLPPPANPSEQRQHKMQRERLADEFTASLNSFQNTQRMAAQKEKEQMQKTKINAGLNEPYLGKYMIYRRPLTKNETDKNVI